MEELAAAAQKESQTDADDHHVIGEIGRIKDLADGQPRQLFHEQDAGLAAKERLVPPDGRRVEILGAKHPVQPPGFAEEPKVEEDRVEMPEKGQRRG